ncbi:hypothetical protein SDC9_159130 [bioreactor metagenome]|uniref:Uncharacterized protein n=1 Tax=bioreactor metagenome TaxID=1076179 RepID=A0A645FEC4_9ZZZZ
MSGKLAAFAGLRALRHLDLNFTRVRQIVDGDAETSAGDLTDGAAAVFAVGSGGLAGGVFAAFAAVAHGADAVQVVDFKRVKVGERSAVDGSTNPGPNAGWTQDARNAGGAYIYTNSFGETTELEKPKRAVYETTVKALFLVTNARFKTVTGDLKKEENAVARQVEKRLDAPVTADGLGAAIGQLPTPESPSADPAAAATAPQKAPPTQVQLRNDPVTL